MSGNFWTPKVVIEKMKNYVLLNYRELWVSREFFLYRSIRNLIFHSCIKYVQFVHGGIADCILQLSVFTIDLIPYNLIEFSEN